MLVELGVVEQRYGAVCEVINDGETVTAVAHRFGCLVRRFIGGCASTRRRVWPGWLIGQLGRIRVLIRCRSRSKR